MAPLSPSLRVMMIFFTILLSVFVISHQEEQLALNSSEQEAVYRALESVNSAIPWRSLFPDDLCLSGPHGVVCDYFVDEIGMPEAQTPHVAELSFGYVSDYSPSPPCSPNSTLHSSIFTSFPHLRKLFFYKCFAETRVSVPEFSPSFTSSIEEIVFIDNPALTGPVGGVVRNFTNLRRLVLSGNGLYGKLPRRVSQLVNLEQLTVSDSRLNGDVLVDFAKLKKLKVLDLSHNGLEGAVPDSIGRSTELLKLDLSHNRFAGKIPEGIKNLQRLEFLDLSGNRFGNFGIPYFLGGMPGLKEMYLSGNLLGGQIPEIWETLGGLLALGLSGVGLAGRIPGSMGVSLKKLCYLGLDNNKLEGALPEELGNLQAVSELNLENNLLSGKIPFTGEFTARVGAKLKLGGNPDICVDEGLKSSGKHGGSLEQVRICSRADIPTAVPLNVDSSANHVPWPLMLFGLFVFTFSFSASC